MIRILIIALICAATFVSSNANADGLGVIDTGQLRSRNTNALRDGAPRKQQKPTKAEIKAWLDPRGACPSYFMRQYMMSQAYPDRTNCAHVPRIHGLGAIDTGSGQSIGRGYGHGSTSSLDVSDLLATLKGAQPKGVVASKQLMMPKMDINVTVPMAPMPAPSPSSAQSAFPQKTSCEYRGAFTGTNGELFSRVGMRAQEELELDQCTTSRRLEHDMAVATYNAKMALWEPCATDARKIARSNFRTDEHLAYEILLKCSAMPVMPREPEECTNFWSGFETAARDDPRWVYLRHIEQWEICLRKQVARATSKCMRGDQFAMTQVDAEIARICNEQPSRPIINGESPTSVAP